MWTRAPRSSIAIPTRGSSSTISASCNRACRSPAQPWADLPKVLELAKRKNAVIKVSGACTLSKEPYPFPDIWDPLAQVFDAWGFDRCLWRTDWTRAFAVVNYEQAVEPFLKTDRLSDTERAMLMGDACAKAYGWSLKKG
jgi:L-fuconolactonase